MPVPLTKKASSRASLRKQTTASVSSLQRQATATASLRKQSSSLTKQASNASVRRQGSSLQTQSSNANSSSSLKKQASTASQNGKRKADAPAGPSRNKRQRKEAKKFEPEGIEPKTKRPMKSKKKEKSEKTKSYRKGDYLAVRNDQDGYFLCRAIQNAFTDSTTLKIWWLDKVDGTDDQYKLVEGKRPTGYYFRHTDTIEVDSIVCKVKLPRVKSGLLYVYVLGDAQRDKVDRELKRALDREQGIDSSEEEEDEEEKGSEEDDEEEEEKPKKKASKKAAPKKKKAASARGGKAGKKTVATKAKKTSKKGDKSAEKKKKEKEKKAAKPKRGALVPNPNVKVWNKDPLLESNEKVPFVSIRAQNKLVGRAVMMNDMKLLQSYIDDIKHISHVNGYHSVGYEKSPINMAIEKQNTKALQLLLKECWNRDPKKKKVPTATLR